MAMNKVKALLRFLFLIVPFFIMGGLELIFLFNKNIMLYSYVTKTLKKNKKKDRQEIICSIYEKSNKIGGTNGNN